MRLYTISLQVFTIASAIHALQYDPTMVQWNLNQAQHADDPMDYWGEWHNHTYNPSPENWRFPFYTLMLDKWVNGDPKNDDANGTIFEHDLFETQLRHGGDIRGLMNSLDYLQGMGIKVPFFGSSLRLGDILFWDDLAQSTLGI
jgi:alpha-1,3-glucan synthase